MSDEPLVQVSGLHKQYGAVYAVRGLNLSLRRGQILGLLGANGAGKTTTMAMIAGVLAPSAGSIRIAGHDLASKPLAAKARLGYLPETPPLYPELTVDEFLHHCATLRGVHRTRIKDAVAQSKSRCALTETGNRLLGNLSKGYRQRVGIAQAIVHEPDLVILDEPTSGLDPAQLRDIRLVIRELGNRHAVIFSTHLLPEVQQVCDQVQIIHEGQLTLSAPMNALPGAQHEYRVHLIDNDNRDVPLAALRSLSMVEDVRPLGSSTAGPPGGPANADIAGATRLVVRIADEECALRAFSRACAEHGWLLLELTPQRQSLEELFMASAYPARAPDVQTEHPDAEVSRDSMGPGDDPPPEPARRSQRNLPSGTQQ